MRTLLPLNANIRHGSRNGLCIVLGTRFHRLIPEAGPASQNAKDVERLVFVSGKLYYELVKERKQHGLEDKIAITRVEQVRRRVARDSEPLA